MTTKQRRWSLLFSITANFLCFYLFSSCSQKSELPEILDGQVVSPNVAGQVLHLYIWSNYHSPEAIKNFEKLYQVKVVIETYDNNEVIEQKLQARNTDFDVVVPSDYMVESLAKQGLILQLDAARLPGITNIDPLLDANKNGARYGVPYLWGTSGFAYRTDKISEHLDSWDSLFDQKFKGKILLLDDMREVFGMALKKLGYSANSTDSSHLAEAKKLLIEQRSLILAYDSSDFAGKLKTGDVWIAHGYSGELANVARESQGKIKYVIPKEGATYAVDNLAIVKDSKNIELAYLFLEYMLDPKIAAETTNITGYATANHKAHHFIKPELAQDLTVFPPEDILSRCERILDIGEATPRFDQAWTEIKAQ